MRRRDFVKGIAGAIGWPIAVRAQQPDRQRRVGVLLPSAPRTTQNINPGSPPSDKRCKNWAGPRAATYRSTSTGPPIPPRFVDRRRNWWRSRRTRVPDHRRSSRRCRTGRYVRISKDRYSRYARRDLLEQFEPLSADAVFEKHEAGGVAARASQTFDEATIGTVCVNCVNCPTGIGTSCQDYPIRCDSGRGAITQGGGERVQQARR